MRAISSWPGGRGFSSHSTRLSKWILVACTLTSAAFQPGCASGSPGSNASPVAAQIAVVPSSVDFKEVVVGQQNSQTLQISNTGQKPVNLQELQVSGQGFTLSSAKIPVALLPGQRLPITVVFAPSAASTATGSLAISSSDLKAPVSVPLAGSGQKASPQLQILPSALNFGAVAVNSSAAQNGTLKNTGNVALTVSSFAVSNATFSTAGLWSGVSLAPGQTLEFTIAFHPSITGTSSATLSVGSAALASPAQIPLSGSATNAAPTTSPAHSVTLLWNPSSSSVVGYHVYRGSTSGGPYSRITSSNITSVNYTDAAVQSGARYYYVVSAIDSQGAESPFSNEAVADVPNP